MAQDPVNMFSSSPYNQLQNIKQEVDESTEISETFQEYVKEENKQLCDEKFLDIPNVFKQEELILKEDEENSKPSEQTVIECDYLEELEMFPESHLTSHLLEHTGPEKATAFKSFEEFKNCPDIVNFLINKRPFSHLNYDEKIIITKEIKCPTPDLSKTLVNIGAAGKPNRTFNTDWYKKYDWLTGSFELNKLFCWPCVLFASSSSEKVWCKSGFSDLKNLNRGLAMHNKSSQHISSNCRLILMRKQKQNMSTVLDSARKIDIENFNSRVKENRQIIRHLIRLTMYLCMQELPFRDHDESDESLNRGHFKELVSLVSEFDTNLKSFLEKDNDAKSVFSGTSKTIQIELVDSIAFIINKQIEKEIENSPFFSWQVDETTDINYHSQLSVILRYIKDGEPVERFMGFFDVSSGRSAEDIFQFLVTKFQKLNLNSKLVAQSYDGTSVMSGEVNGLQAKIKSVAPQAIFTHCYAHVLNLVLSGACSSIHQVKVFFAGLTGFATYFLTSTKRSQVLEQICGSRIHVTTCWNFSSRAVLTVNNNKNKLIEVFDHIINDPYFDDISISAAVDLKHFLEKPLNIFFLETFTLIFQYTDVVFNILQDKFTDIVKARNVLESTLNKLREFRNNIEHFNKIYSQLGLTSLQSKRRKGMELEDKEQQLRKFFYEILDIITTQIQVRFKDLEKLHIFDLINASKFEYFSKNFPTKLLSQLLEQYKFFDKDILKSELVVLYSDFLENQNCGSPYDMLKYWHENDLHSCMPELFKLICVAVVLPVTSASTERSFSALKRIKTYMRNTTGQARSSNMAQISIEKVIIKSQIKDYNFIENIIDHFAEYKNRRIPLIYKHL